MSYSVPSTIARQWKVAKEEKTIFSEQKVVTSYPFTRCAACDFSCTTTEELWVKNFRVCL